MTMTLQECLRYNSYLKSLFTDIQEYLEDADNVTTHREIGRKSEALNDPLVKDEVVGRQSGISPQLLVGLMQDLIEEMCKIQDAIDEVKDGTEYDKLVIKDNMQYYELKSLERLLILKSSSSTKYKTGIAYNPDGTHKAYTYRVDVYDEVDFDRDAIRKLMHTIREDRDNTSTKIYEILLRKVEFCPKYHCGDNIYDILTDSINE